MVHQEHQVLMVHQEVQVLQVQLELQVPQVHQVQMVLVEVLAIIIILDM